MSPNARLCPGCGLLLHQYANALEWAQRFKTCASENDQTLSRDFDLAMYGVSPAYIRNQISSPRQFRLAVPHLAYLRCWFCDIENIQKAGSEGPRLPAMKYAHKTINPDILPGLGTDWQLEAQKVGPPPHPINTAARVARDRAEDNMFWREHQNSFVARKLAQGRALDSDKRQYDREAKEHNKDVLSLLDRFRREENEPCPHCGEPYPYLLREKKDARASRVESNIPQQVQTNLTVGLALPGTKDGEYEAKRLAQELLLYFFHVCEVPISPVYVKRISAKYGLSPSKKLASGRAIGSRSFLRLN